MLIWIVKVETSKCAENPDLSPTRELEEEGKMLERHSGKTFPLPAAFGSSPPCVPF